MSRSFMMIMWLRNTESELIGPTSHVVLWNKRSGMGYNVSKETNHRNSCVFAQ